MLGTGVAWDVGPGEDAGDDSDCWAVHQGRGPIWWLWAINRGCLPYYSPSNMSTMRKKAREKEDFPLPVRPQIPIWKERNRYAEGPLEVAGSLWC